MLLRISRPFPGSGLKATGRDISQTSSCFIEKGQWGKENIQWNRHGTQVFRRYVPDLRHHLVYIYSVHPIPMFIYWFSA